MTYCEGQGKSTKCLRQNSRYLSQDTNLGLLWVRSRATHATKFSVWKNKRTAVVSKPPSRTKLSIAIMT